MKFKNVVLLLVTLATTAAIAEILTMEERGSTRAEACSRAKQRAQTLTSGSQQEVKEYGSCSCSQDKDGYICSVDVRIGKR